MKRSIKLKTVDVSREKTAFSVWRTLAYGGFDLCPINRGVKNAINGMLAIHTSTNFYLGAKAGWVTRRSGERSRARFGSEWLPREMRHPKSLCDLPGHEIPSWFVKLNARFTSSNPFNRPISNSRHVAIHRRFCIRTVSVLKCFKSTVATWYTIT